MEWTHGIDLLGMLTPYLFVVILTAIPALKLLKRTGLSRVWAAVVILPLGSILLFWVIAYKHWPIREAS